MKFKILTSQLLDDFIKQVIESPLDRLDRAEKVEMPVDYFQFYKSVSSVYSSKIEGEDIDSLSKIELNPFEVFYYASLIHLVFVKIHPFQDGNGRTEHNRKN